MKTKVIWRTLLFFSISVWIYGCTNKTNFVGGKNEMPANWSLAVSADPDSCTSISGEYETYGVAKINEQNSLIEASLDVALGQPLPSARLPETIGLEVDTATKLIINFSQSGVQPSSVPTKCEKGWYLLEKHQSDVYLGDGVNMDFSSQKIYLGKSQNGDLIVHLIAEEQYSSLVVFISKEHSDSWFLFKEILN